MKALAKLNTEYKTEIQTGNHNLIVDEPKHNGGKDLGPSPGDLLRSSLASCTAITLKMYANRKEWDTGEIEVEVDLIQVQDEAYFKVDISFENKNLSEEQLKRLDIIANKCPVHKLLQKGNRIEVQLKQ